MNNPTSWYYASHKKRAFLYQQQLCDAVRWTKYNLEGQKQISPNSLSAIQGNPLTIRLLALDEALKHFAKIKKIEKKIKELARVQFGKGKIFLMKGTWHAESSPLNTNGAPIETIDIAGEHLELKHIDVQLALYEFFTNFGSAIDRLTFEIDMLYNLEIPQLNRYWGTLTNPKKDYLSTLKEKDKDLADLLANYATTFGKAPKYRNRMVHDGIIKVEVDMSIVSKAIVLLAEDPDDDNSPMNVDAIELCEKTRIELLNLLEESYQLMFQHFQTSGNPPW